MRQAAKTPKRGGARALLGDLGSAFLALLLALVVWVVAVGEQDPPRVDFFEGIPVKYINLDENLMLLGKVEERVRVTVRAPRSHWQTLTPDALEATVDLRDLEVGSHTVEIRVRTADKTATVVERTPARVVVHLEERVRREMDVQAAVTDIDHVPPGYTLLAPYIAPQKVMVAGPRSLVDSVSQVVAKVQLRGSKTAVESQVAPIAVDAQGAPVSGVDLTPRTVTVRLEVEPKAEFRDVTMKAVLKGAPAPGYWVSNITIEPAAVTVEGKPEVIRTMPAVVSTVPIDIAGVKESISKRVALVLPEGVSVYSADTTGQTVLVRVEVTAIIGGKTMQPRVELLGLRSGLSATASPDNVDVILSGPLPELQALQAEDVRVVVNLFRLGTGRHKVTPTILLPEGSNLKVESFAPDVIEVTITTAPRGGP